MLGRLMKKREMSVSIFIKRKGGFPLLFIF